MKRILFLVLLLLGWANSYAQIAGWQTAWTYPEYPSGQTSGSAMVQDRAGNLYVTGIYKDSFYQHQQSTFLLKYTPTGQMLWRKNLTANGTRVVGASVRIDSLDRLYVAGNYGEYSTPYAPATNYNLLIDTVVAADSAVNARYNGFLFCLDTSGHRRWNKFFTGTGGITFNGFAVNKSGQIAMTGEYIDTLRIDTFMVTQPLVGQLPQSFIARFDENGNSKMLRSAFTSKSLGGCYINAKNDIYVTGQFRSYIKFDGVRFDDQSTGSILENGFIVKLDSMGKAQWITGTAGYLPPSGPSTFGTTSLGAPLEKPNGNILIGGSYGGCSMSAKNGSLTLPHSDQYPHFLLCLNPAGTPIWLKGSNPQTGGSATLGGVTVDANNNIYITGSVYDGPAKWGTDTITWGNTTSRTDAFLYKLDSNGKLLWGRFAGGSIHDYGCAVVLTPDGNSVYMAGYSASPDSMNFGTFKEPVAGVFTLFVAKTSTAPLKVSDIPAASDFEVVLYPNPAGETLGVKLPQGLQIKEALIVDATGQVRLQMEAPPSHGSEVSLPVSLLPPGNYFLLLRAKDGRQSAKSFTRL